MAQDASTGVIAHWSTLLGGFHISPLEFYSAVERAIEERQIPDTSTSRVDYREGGIVSARREYLRVTRGKNVFDICGAPFGTGFFVSSWLTETHSLAGLLYLLLAIFVLGSSAFVTLGFLNYVLGSAATAVLVIIGFPFVVIVGLPLLFFGMAITASHVPAMSDALLSVPLFGKIYERLFHPITYYKIDTALMFQKAVHAALLQAIDEMTSAKGIRALTDAERQPLLKAFAGK